MKYIIIGLGNFGSSLGMMLTDLGHEVIGVDSSQQKVEAFKDNITSTICIDGTDIHALSTLPLTEADAVIVGIGEDFGASVMVTALLKQKKINRLICRSVSPIHESVFQALGVKEILHPEKDAAERLVKRIIATEVIDSYQIGQDHVLLEMVAPQRYIGSKVVEVDFKGRFRLNLVTIIKHRSAGSTTRPFNLGHAVDFVYAGSVIEKEDILVLFGSKENIRKFTGS